MSFNFSNDLNAYSLSQNSNVPTSVFDMNHFYSFRQQQDSSTPPKKEKFTLLAEGENVSSSSSSSPSEISAIPSLTRMSKLDLLIHTATSADLDSMLQSNKRIKEEVHDNVSVSVSVTEQPIIKKPKLDMEHLCSQAEKIQRLEEQQHSPSFQNWMAKKIHESKAVQQPTQDAGHLNSSRQKHSNFPLSLFHPDFDASIQIEQENLHNNKNHIIPNFKHNNINSNVDMCIQTQIQPQVQTSLDTHNHKFKSNIKQNNDNKGTHTAQINYKENNDSVENTSETKNLTKKNHNLIQLEKEKDKLPKKGIFQQHSHVPTAIKLASPSTNTKRQRSGPSCDCCRARKIKCDSEIFIMSELGAQNSKENIIPKDINSHIAHCEFVSMNPVSGYQYYKIIKDGEHSLNTKLTTFSFLQFKPCSACSAKNLKCCFSKGFTRNDIIRFNKHERLANAQYQKNSNDSLILSSVNESSSSSLPTPSPTPAININSQPVVVNGIPIPNAITASSVLNGEYDERKSNKKTSCKTCRVKKIKCVKLEGSQVCVHCIKKAQGCVFE
ncbi:Sut2 protein [Martiniozyma asiatica (nom. inval.)]|nr:Sut2 protein [Martiniozyma asiatica]